MHPTASFLRENIAPCMRRQWRQPRRELSDHISALATLINSTIGHIFTLLPFRGNTNRPQGDHSCVHLHPQPAVTSSSVPHFLIPAVLTPCRPSPLHCLLPLPRTAAAAVPASNSTPSVRIAACAPLKPTDTSQVPPPSFSPPVRVPTKLLPALSTPRKGSDHPAQPVVASRAPVPPTL